jgi:hypothetical protein
MPAPAPLPLRSAIGTVYGVPKVHFKGQQDDFYVMVSALLESALKKACALSVP